MKKIYAIIIIGLLITTYTHCSAQISSTDKTAADEWTGKIRIEGDKDTIWIGTVTVTDTSLIARNTDTGEMEEFYISYPSVLGAVIEASKENNGDFSYTIDYYPGYNSFIFTSIKNDGNWWQYWVDYEYATTGSNNYKLTDESQIIFAYTESYPAHVLKLNIDKKLDLVIVNLCVITILDEDNNPISDATLHVGEKEYLTNKNGIAKKIFYTKNNCILYAEKQGYVRSEKINIS